MGGDRCSCGWSPPQIPRRRFGCARGWARGVTLTGWVLAKLKLCSYVVASLALRAACGRLAFRYGELHTDQLFGFGEFEGFEASGGEVACADGSEEGENDGFGA